MTRLSDDLTHFFASDHFAVKKAAYLEQEIERLENAHAGLVEELQAMTDAYAKAMMDVGVTHYPEALAVVRKARAALAAAKL